MPTPPILSPARFGKRLIETGDLDPVYILLHGAKLDSQTLYKWLLAYWCYYHVGTASWIIEEPDYWRAMETAAGSKNWPRCHERRHFRGNRSIKSVAWLKQRGIGNLFSGLVSSHPKQLPEVMNYVQTWYGFGPWIAFKVADMLERLSLCPVVFDAGAMFLFDSPREGADLMWSKYGNLGKPTTIQPKHVGTWAVNSILEALGSLRTPPDYKRDAGVQEAETILCKWKSYVEGHYEIGEDIRACQSGLLRFPKCKLSQKLLLAGQKARLWK